MLVIDRLKRFRVPELGPFDGFSFTEFSGFILSWLGQLVFSRPHSLGCGISSLCCIVCVPLRNLGTASTVPEYQRISTELWMLFPAIIRPQIVFGNPLPVVSWRISLPLYPKRGWRRRVANLRKSVACRFNYSLLLAVVIVSRPCPCGPSS